MARERFIPGGLDGGTGVEGRRKKTRHELLSEEKITVQNRDSIKTPSEKRPKKNLGGLSFEDSDDSDIFGSGR